MSGFAALLFQLELFAVERGVFGFEKQAAFIVRHDDRGSRRDGRGLEIFAGDAQRAGQVTEFLIGQFHRQTFRRLREIQFAFVAEQFDALDLVRAGVIGFGERLDDKFAVVRPAQCNRVKRFALGREADVLGAVLKFSLNAPPLACTSPSP